MKIEMQQQNNLFNNQNYSYLTGVFLVVAGILYLLYKMGLPLPWWLFSWPMILISIGLFQGVKSNFKNPSWLILMVVGGVFLIENALRGTHLRQYIIPIILISIGGFILINKGRSTSNIFCDGTDSSGDPLLGTITSSEDAFEAISIFGGTKRSIFSKNFRGGEVVNVFGGSEVNLLQADATGPMVIECVNLFGGTKLLVPTNWEVRSEVVSIFGGVGDKRFSPEMMSGGKVLIIKGVNIFGGIDIKSY